MEDFIYLRIELLKGRKITQFFKKYHIEKDEIFYDPFSKYCYVKIPKSQELKLPKWVEVISKDMYENIFSHIANKIREKYKLFLLTYVIEQIQSVYPELFLLVTKLQLAKDKICEFCKIDEEALFMNILQLLDDPVSIDEIKQAENKVKNREINLDKYIRDIKDGKVKFLVYNFYYLLMKGVLIYRKKTILFNWLDECKMQIDATSDKQITESYNEPDYLRRYIEKCPKV